MAFPSFPYSSPYTSSPFANLGNGSAGPNFPTLNMTGGGARGVNSTMSSPATQPQQAPSPVQTALSTLNTVNNFRKGASTGATMASNLGQYNAVADAYGVNPGIMGQLGAATGLSGGAPALQSQLAFQSVAGGGNPLLANSVFGQGLPGVAGPYTTSLPGLMPAPAGAAPQFAAPSAASSLGGIGGGPIAPELGGGYAPWMGTGADMGGGVLGGTTTGGEIAGGATAGGEAAGAVGGGTAAGETAAGGIAAASAESAPAWGPMAWIPLAIAGSALADNATGGHILQAPMQTIQDPVGSMTNPDYWGNLSGFNSLFGDGGLFS